MAAVMSCENALLVSQNNKTAAMLVFKTSPVGVQLFSYVNDSICRSNSIYKAVSDVNENAFYVMFDAVFF